MGRGSDTVVIVQAPSERGRVLKIHVDVLSDRVLVQAASNRRDRAGPPRTCTVTCNPVKVLSSVRSRPRGTRSPFFQPISNHPQGNMRKFAG